MSVCYDEYYYRTLNFKVTRENLQKEDRGPENDSRDILRSTGVRIVKPLFLYDYLMRDYGGN